MRKLSFMENWTCRPLSREGEELPVTLPHDAMRTEARTPASRGEGNIGWFEGGDYEYRKRFTVPAELRDKLLTLEFESVYHNAEVWINGEKVLFRPYGYTNFYVELNPHIRMDAENELRVVARNADQPNSRWYSGTGIYRPVWLYAFEKEHIILNSVKLRTLSVEPAVLRVELRTTAPGPVDLTIEREGTSVLTASLEADAAGRAERDLVVPEAKLWSPEDPALYTARLRFGSDEVCETFGIRALSWTPDKGVALNGRRVVLRGACIHHDNGILGACTYPEVEERRIRILKQAGYNAVRSAHNPASKYLLEACDRLGMLMMDEYVDCWYMHKTEHDYASYVTDWWREDLKDLVEKDFNHPCVIMYSTGNEVAESAQEKGIRLQQAFTDYLHELDPTRPVTCGINIFFNFLSSVGMGVYSDEKAKKQAEQAEKAKEEGTKKPKKKAVGSEFFNKIAAKIGTDFMKFGATLPPCDWKTKDVFAAMDVAGYNYGNWRYKHDSKKYPDRLILGSETLIGDAWDFWEIAKERPQIVGDFVWAAWDYIGECGENSPEFSDYVTDAPEDRVRGGTCRIDMTGKPNPEADYTRVAFEQARGPFLAVFPPNVKEKPPLTGWQLTRGQRSWSWEGCEGEAAQVEVFARAASVELFVNGQRIGKKPVKKGRVSFRTEYRPGELTAVAYDENKREVGSDSLKTAGKETLLRLEPEKTECRPGEMVYFRVRYTDEAGEWKPLEKHEVRVRAENGAVMGAANASCCFRGNFAQPQTPTYLGEAQTVVQAGGPGVLRVWAADENGEVCAEVLCRE